MNRVSSTLTVFFEGPFWVGIFERVEDGMLSASRVVFGAEPKDGEIWEFVLKNHGKLTFSPAVESTLPKETRNPQKARREAGKQLAAGIGTKSQQALQRQREERKVERKSRSRAERMAEKERQFAMKQQKRKEKHRGR